MTTFSQLVDKMVAECKRKDLQLEIQSYVNQTIRELQYEPNKNMPIFYPDNLKEDVVTANLADGWYWDIPKVSLFMAIAGALCMSVWEDSEPVWSRPQRPGAGMGQGRSWYYRSGQRVFFKNYGGLGGQIGLSWYEFVPNLTYYPLVNRPAQYSDATDWEYSDAYNVDDATRAEAESLTSNWLLLRHAIVVEEGVRAKVYKRLSDDTRMRIAFSAYTAARAGVAGLGSVDLGVYYS